jgi:hypothetical protein
VECQLGSHQDEIIITSVLRKRGFQTLDCYATGRQHYKGVVLNEASSVMIGLRWRLRLSKHFSITNLLLSAKNPIFLARLILEYFKNSGLVDMEKYFQSPPCVLAGPFKDLKYPEFRAKCSAIYPKLFGCYESELTGALMDFSKNDYSEILDIGCAEGYYAVGLSLMFSKSVVYAYDIDPEARRACGEMAYLNGRHTNFIIRSKCDANELAKFSFNGRALIICDCEGYEAKLFCPTSVANLGNCDLIIETHDFISPRVSSDLRNLFSKTHEVVSVYSRSDLEKALTYQLSSDSNLNPLSRWRGVYEGRPQKMEWLVCSTKN